LDAFSSSFFFFLLLSSTLFYLSFFQYCVTLRSRLCKETRKYLANAKSDPDDLFGLRTALKQNAFLLQIALSREEAAVAKNKPTATKAKVGIEKANVVCVVFCVMLLIVLTPRARVLRRARRRRVLTAHRSGRSTARRRRHSHSSATSSS
jgi:hypothetical protein